MSKWQLLALAIASEVTASLSLKGALTIPGLYVVVACGYTVAFACLIMLMRKGAGIGVVYAIWAASGVALTSALSAAIFGEPLTATMGSGLVLIIAGVFMVEVGAQNARLQEALEEPRTDEPR